MYSRISSSIWRFDKCIEAARRRRLSVSPSYVALCALLVSKARVVEHKRQESRRHPGYYRIRVRLRASARTIDLFHNSASGYRAQYYTSRSNGERANAHAVKELSRLALASLTRVSKRTCPVEWVHESLIAGGSKVWIHQGVWLRRAARADRHLLVDKWEREQASPDAARRKKAFWSALTPSRETDIEIIGGFVSLSATHLGVHKPRRSIELHQLGFT
jgi:hypothetical protein